MPDNEAFVHDLLLPDSNTRRFHAGDACQWSPPLPDNEVLPEVAAMIESHRATIHAPGSRARGRFGKDEDGNDIETSYLGVGVDPETGALLPLDADGNAIGRDSDTEKTEAERTAEREKRARDREERERERERQAGRPVTPAPARKP